VNAPAPAFRRIADSRGLSVPQVVVAWLTSLAAAVVPIVGTGRPAHLVQLAEPRPWN
jgi:aryl-alcohol dehydrogenase-like predicted oxidoreductase